MPSNDALVKAVEVVFPSGKAAKPAVAGKPTDRGLDAKLAAAKSTPPNINDQGQDATSAGMQEVPNPLKLTDEEFKALPESTLRRMRGDTVAA